MARTLAEDRLLEELAREAEPKPLNPVWFLATVGPEKRRKRLSDGTVRTYEGYRLRVPREAVEELGLGDGGTVVAALARPRWYHLIDYREEPLRSRFRQIKKPWVKAEICMLGLAPEELCREYRLVPVIASEEELKRLGLEPGQPVTLRELLERARSLTG